MGDGLIVLLFSALGVLSGFAAYAERKRIRKLWEQADKFEPPNAYGVTAWATQEELVAAGLAGMSGIFFGFSPDGKQRLKLSRPGNVLLCAGARAGKFLTIIATLVMSLPRRSGALIVDPKGEITCVCGGSLRRRGKVYVVNPYQVAVGHMKGLMQACINPLDDLDPRNPSFISDCLALPATFWDDSLDAREPHWLENSLPVVAAIIYWLKRYAPPEKQNLAYMRQILTGATGQSFHRWCRMAVRLNDKFLTGILSRFAAPGAEENRELTSILSTAITQTAWLEDPSVAACLRRSDVSLGAAKQPGVTISVIEPATRTGDGRFSVMVSGWTAHMVLNLGISGNRTPCLLLVDEAASLGRRNLNTWRHLLAAGAGTADVRLMLAYQNISQIKGQFGEHSWSTVIQNCALSIFFACRDHETRQVVSDLAGTTEVITHTRSVVFDDRREKKPNVSDTRAQATRAFITPAEVGRLEPNEMICFCDGLKSPLKAIRKPYTRVCWGHRPNPYYRAGGWLGRLFR